MLYDQNGAIGKQVLGEGFDTTGIIGISFTDKRGIFSNLAGIALKEEFKKRKGQDIYPNVDLYSAPVYHTMGIDPDLFTPVFAISRISGWSAHIIEEKYAEAQPKPMLYRPKADYIGRYCGPEACEYNRL